MTAHALIAELSERGIAIIVRDSLILSKPAIPADLLPALQEHKADVIRELEYQDNVARIKRTFGATELTGARSLKMEYNVHLAKLRGLEAYLDDKNIPQAEREGSIPEFQRLSHKLSDLLNVLGDYTHEQATGGFEISGKVAKNCR